MFTAEEIEECDIFPKKITAALLFKSLIYIMLMVFGTILLYSFYSGRDFTSIITMESLKYGTDTYFLQKILKMEERYNYNSNHMELHDDNLTMNSFISDYLSESIPAVFRKSSNKWLASGKWDDLFFEKNLRDAKITVNIKQRKLKRTGIQSESTFHDFIRNQNSEKKNNFIYWDDNIPAILEKDVEIPKFLAFLPKNSTKIWKGKNATVSYATSEEHEVYFCQIKGRKEFILSPFLFRNGIYPYKKNVGSPKISAINFFNRENTRFPNYGRVIRLYFILDQGDCLFIPSFWWRQFQSYDEEDLSIIFKFNSDFRYLNKIIQGIDEDNI